MSEDEPNFEIPAGVQPPLEDFPEVPQRQKPRSIKIPVRVEEPKPTKPYRARYQDSTNESVQALKSGLTSEGSAPTPQEQEKSGKIAAFLGRAVAETGSFDIEVYLRDHPERQDEARYLGLIK